MSSTGRHRVVPDRNAIMRRIAFRREAPKGSSPAVSVHNVSMGSDSSTDRHVLKALPSINYNAEEAENGKVQDGSIASVRLVFNSSSIHVPTPNTSKKKNYFLFRWTFHPH